MTQKVNQVIFEFDQGVIENIKKAFTDKSSVEIGILNGTKTDIKKAAVHEFGYAFPVTPGMNSWFWHKTGKNLKASRTHIWVPARSFMRKTVSNRGRDFMEWIQATENSVLEAIVMGNWKTQLDHFGRKWVMYIKECFATRGFGQWQPLSAFTVWKKGHDTPLHESGRLSTSIDSQVVMK